MIYNTMMIEGLSRAKNRFANYIEKGKNMMPDEALKVSSALSAVAFSLILLQGPIDITVHEALKGLPDNIIHYMAIGMFALGNAANIAIESMVLKKKNYSAGVVTSASYMTSRSIPIAIAVSFGHGILFNLLFNFSDTANNVNTLLTSDNRSFAENTAVKKS